MASQHILFINRNKGGLSRKSVLRKKRLRSLIFYVETKDALFLGKKE
ncbi:hypothetical protein HMPREF9087_1805 [Enterococcus casseliflavus ATCC 12755]|uniref:Uncharacterized protein n=1 Tax=Enterococcus casseliflavus ATCC 12755 TaxID=888066 RepID=F0EK63_ENTCA|nr:hypothetical protein HMPREF9087_1805 [Enterococcus casseliflavus ATCC 12755]